MALSDSGMGFFLTLPEELHETCPLSSFAANQGPQAAPQESPSDNEGLSKGGYSRGRSFYLNPFSVEDGGGAVSGNAG